MSGTDPTKSTAIQTAILMGNDAGMIAPSTATHTAMIPLENHAGMMAPSGGVRRTSGLAIASMVCGIVSLTFMWYFWVVILSPIAIILGSVAHWRIKQNRQELMGECQATAGIATGSIALVGSIIFIIIIVQALGRLN
jgi:Domain of unknown function (DUF4190)